MTHAQQMITIPNSLYGDQTVTAYCRSGLGVFKQHKRWQVVHVASGMSIGSGRGGDRRTRKGAFAIMDALLQTPVDWSKPYDQIRNDVAANRTAIMLALSASRDQ
ncbi:hypothetical protein [Paracoccus zhejiangensis]|uniref:Uncharacterized protein n=1 Tax=Paracoccus zhejiangensis TaxID=1077935 RepID=A0A2H5F5L8_9RHOB|nr:hypothetical protein [Paracoccus zhejiangensis]AUH66824.1 hypothetical protein CX676_21240 [Paracoccus zhejiangensis]